MTTLFNTTKVSIDESLNKIQNESIQQKNDRYLCLIQHNFKGGNDCKSCINFKTCWPFSL